MTQSDGLRREGSLELRGRADGRAALPLRGSDIPLQLLFEKSRGKLITGEIPALKDIGISNIGCIGCIGFSTRGRALQEMC